MIFGDFNDLLCNEDKWGRSDHSRSLMEGFRETLEDCDLTELELCGGKYTWEKCRGKREWVREKLDRAFSTSSWINKLCKLSVHHTTRSDHDPIQLELVSTSISRRLFRFRFENIWLKDPDSKREVQTYWAKIPPIHLLPKLHEVSSFMAKWGKTFFNKFREKVRNLREVIAGLVNRVDTIGVGRYLEEVERFNDLLLQEETYWKQRAKLFWLEEGDANTKFFHATTTSRKKTNHISYLEKDT